MIEMRRLKNVVVFIKTLLPADVFKSLCNKYIKLVDSAHFLSVARLEWQALLKETEVELEPLADMH